MRCTYYEPHDGRTRCTAPAEVHLLQPDGQRNPGSRLCARHAQAIIEEYTVKLGEHWTTEALTPC